MDNTIVWADIPVTDLERAMKFYSAVLQQDLETVEGMEGIALVAGGASSQEELNTMTVGFDLPVVSDRKPSRDGCTIHLNGRGDPEGMLQRAAGAGGEILMALADMGDMVGSIGFFLDSEGNRIGVHKPPEM